MASTEEPKAPRPASDPPPKARKGEDGIEQAVEEGLEYFTEGDPPTPEQLRGNAEAPG